MNREAVKMACKKWLNHLEKKNIKERETRKTKRIISGKEKIERKKLRQIYKIYMGVD